jgi:type I restriction enzyme S subunit
MSKRVPKLRFKEFESDGEWEEKRLGDIVLIIMGQSPSSKSYNSNGNGIYLIQGNADIKNRKTYPRIWTTESKKECKIDDIILTVRAPVGYVAKSIHNACIGRGVCALRSKKNYFLNFVYYFLLYFEKEWKKLGQGSTFTAIGTNDIKNLKIRIPVTQKEQQKIANTLSSLDNLIMSEDKKLQALQTYKKGLMQQLFPKEGERVPKLRFKEFESDGEWGEKKIGDIFKVTRGEVLSMNMVEKNSSKITPYPVYSSQTKNNGLAGYYSDYLFENAITWTTDGANAGDVNFRKGKFYCTNVCGVLINTNGYANQFIAELLNTVTKKHVSYVGNPKLMNGVMASIIIPIPSLQEQQKIANTLSSLDNLIENQSKKIEALKEHKKGLMQQMFVSDEER